MSYRLRQVDHHSRQSSVRLGELAQLPQFGHTDLGVLLPDAERRVADADLATYIVHRRAGIGRACVPENA